MKAITTMVAALVLATAAQAGEKAMPEVKAHITVQSQAGKVLATLQVDNGSKQVLSVPKVIAEDEELFGPYFEVRAKGSATPLQYVGPKVKRGPFGPDDYVKVKAGGRLKHTIDISQAYDFLPGKHDYELRYDGQRIASLGAAAPVLAIPPASFSHTR